MKEFKLIKEYPGSPKINTIHELDDDFKKYSDYWIEIYDEFKTEDDVEVNGSDIIYGVCTKGGWQLSEVTAQKIINKRKNNDPAFSDFIWKFFSSKEARENYVHFHKPLYSLYQITEAISKSFNITEIFNHLKTN